MRKLLLICALLTGGCATLTPEPPRRTAVIILAEAEALVIATMPGGLPVAALWLGLTEWARRQKPEAPAPVAPD